MLINDLQDTQNTNLTPSFTLSRHNQQWKDNSSFKRTYPEPIFIERELRARVASINDNRKICQVNPQSEPDPASCWEDLCTKKYGRMLSIVKHEGCSKLTLIQISQRVGISRECLILLTQNVLQARHQRGATFRRLHASHTPAAICSKIYQLRGHQKIAVGHTHLSKPDQVDDI